MRLRNGQAAVHHPWNLGSFQEFARQQREPPTCSSSAVCQLRRMAEDISKPKCILLAIHYASEGNIKALESLTRIRSDDLDTQLVLRILLTYLPESIEPKEYTRFIGHLCSDTSNEHEATERDPEVDVAPVKEVDEQQARRRAKRLKLLDTRPSNYPEDGPDDALTQFVCHRALRIDEQTGLVNLLPQLVQPFLERNEFIRAWYIGDVLPLLRLQFEYYPEDTTGGRALAEFEDLDAKGSVEFLMHEAAASSSENSNVARDIKGLVGPWMYGNSLRKRRKLGHNADREDINGDVDHAQLQELREVGFEWQYVYRWMVEESREKFELAAEAIENWDGPSDIDLGGLDAGHSDRYLDEETQSDLERQFVQVAFACCYAVESSLQQATRQSYSVLARIARLLDFDPPRDLSVGVEQLPQIRKTDMQLGSSQLPLDLGLENLLDSNHPLTTPSQQNYVLLQMIIFSAHQLSELKHAISIADVATLRFAATAEEQLAVLQRVLHGLSGGGTKRDETQWKEDRAKLLWLRNWGDDAEADDTSLGVFCQVPKQTFEEENLKALIETAAYNLAISLYLKSPSEPLPPERIEQIVLMKAMEAYDGATNGNRTRGGMKKANDIVSTFRPLFPQSLAFGQAIALISATHALSFYSLTLQHGVPFQPVTIRVSQDPIGLIGKVLEQNSSSYTQLDDLVSIARNLVSAGLPQAEVSTGLVVNEEELEAKRKEAERRVTLMAIEAALHEDDFETAYSYIVNRLTPSGADIEAPRDTGGKSGRHARNISNSSSRSRAADAADDVSWRAAFLAGRYRSASASPPSLRRLEQRTELLSLALLLAPVSALSEILVAWRRCEEETTALQLSQQQAEEEIDDRADKRQSLDSLPGNFSVEGDQPALVLNQQRREMGRMTGKSGNGDAPVSMFDLTRSAAQALSKNAFPLRGSRPASASYDTSAMESSVDSLGSEGGTEAQRARKRDMVANAVSGGLASGLGWMLGATPVNQQRSGSE